MHAIAACIQLLGVDVENDVSATQVDISKDGRALQKLRREAERAKRALSSQHQVRVEVESLAEGVDLSEPLTRARFEELNNDLFKKTLGPVRRVCCQPVVHCLLQTICVCSVWLLYPLHMLLWESHCFVGAILPWHGVVGMPRYPWYLCWLMLCIHCST